MSELNRRTSERLRLALPIRVTAYQSRNGCFTEDTTTVEVNRAGARIALRHKVAPNDILRIVSLQNHAEADFRVVGPTRLQESEVSEWGVECTDTERSIWGIIFPPPIPSSDSRAGALLACRGCGSQVFCKVSLVEVEVLESTGAVEMICEPCGQVTPWTFSDLNRRPANRAAPELAPQAAAVGALKGIAERRAHKRLPVKVPVLVEVRNGQREVSRSENISKGGVAVTLSMKVAVGEVVTVVCPYTEGGQNIAQKGEIRRRAVVVSNVKWVYGIRYLP